MTRPCLLALLLLAGCREKASGPIVASVIGPPLTAAAGAPDRGPLPAPAAILALATHQGLIRFDASGQVVPGLAARWIVSDDGRSLLFRLPDERPPIATEAIAARLRAAIAADSRNPLKPLLGAITEVDAVTPQVVDVELSAPRPNILALFAQASLTITGPPATQAPFRLLRLQNGAALLRQRVAPSDDPDARPLPPETITLRGERAAVAVARFKADKAALVLGGGFADLPIARAAALAEGRLRFDPVQGLFGLAYVAAADGFVADPRRRAALAMAIDRDRIGRLLGVPGWTQTGTIVPGGTPEIDHPSAPDWAARPLADRQTDARAAVATWRGAGHDLPPLRIAMPPGPGARLLFAAIAADWRAVGVPAVAVGPADRADLILIDEVAPADTAAFYLRRFACDRGVPCVEATDRVLIAARETPDLADRSLLLAQADAQIAAIAPFIALGAPIRWSLVAPSLDRYRDSPRGIHPLDELRTRRPE